MPLLQRIIKESTGKVLSTLLNQIGPICQSIQQIDLLYEFENSVLMLIKNSFVDSGRKVEFDKTLGLLKG